MEQLSFFEPTGLEVLALAAKHERDAGRAHALAETLNVQGWTASAATVLASALLSERLAAEMYMLAEFEALASIDQ